MKIALAPLALAVVVSARTGSKFHEGADVASLISRLFSYFDLSHIASTVTTTPVGLPLVYDPGSDKFVRLAGSVVQSEDAMYLPICPVDVITAAGQTPASAQSNACTMGVQLTPMPSNAASALFKVLRTKVKLLMSLAKFAPEPLGKTPSNAPIM
ncbi:hypothetical protein IWW55_000088 [Coemansia sp. RSA 2706]|nr:hypothetical protein LPJ63_001297 [Coemansia sp. RSA 2711]KAJ2308997.1 hypothetical protein IWW55_000088 [Coemansia sp. RSA 2706]KAJ2315703.1 hypothetical protein IWW54_000072 [Coemansia sp. RSA 2705]KAJ2322433.1 hypothetical protein IWW52_000081 [Coemansia sp. RSA 2704]KAJ2330219.1 hypothetical protein IWW51_000079 [Coemansia sp. RSA 2702]KAJ2375831.1 hypothetical protein H4S02_008105 [Coemansia sp. RSA 2611]KAJ2739980.1 hypothetical protein H4R23_000078 [Coemansia sp. Cherry 401B]